MAIPLKLSNVEAQAKEIFNVNYTNDVEGEIKQNSATFTATNDNHEANCSITTKKTPGNIDKSNATISIIPVTTTHIKASFESNAIRSTTAYHGITDGNATTNKTSVAATSLISLATAISKQDAERLLEQYPDELNKWTKPNVFKTPAIPSYRSINKSLYRFSSNIQNRHSSTPYKKINNGSGTFTVTSLPLAFSKLRVKDEIKEDKETAKAQNQPQPVPSTMKSTPELQHANNSRRLIKVSRRRLVGDLSQMRSEVPEKIAVYNKRIAEIKLNSSLSFKDERLPTKSQKRKQPVDDLYEHPSKKRANFFDARKLNEMPPVKEQLVEEEKKSEQSEEKWEEKPEFSIKKEELKISEEKELLKTEEKVSTKFVFHTLYYKRRTIIFLLRGGGGGGGVPILVKKLSAYKKSTKKIVSRKNSLKKIACTTLVKLESLFFCNLLDAIICSVW